MEVNTKIIFVSFVEIAFSHIHILLNTNALRFFMLSFFLYYFLYNTYALLFILPIPLVPLLPMMTLFSEFRYACIY